MNQKTLTLLKYLLSMALIVTVLVCGACGKQEPPLVSETGTSEETEGGDTLSEDRTAQDSASSPGEQRTEPPSTEDGDVTKEPAAELQTKPNDTAPDGSGTTVEPSTEPDTPKTLLYEEYMAFTAQQQLDYFYSFAEVEDFFIWYNAALADYKERHPGVEIGPDGITPTP